jgi:cellulose synthase operon protein C
VANKRLDEAQRRVDERQKRDPGNALHQHLQGDLALARRDFAGAERAYREAITLAPQAANGYLNAAKAALARGDRSAAMALLEQGERAAPDDRSLAMARAEWLIAARQRDEALRVYEALFARFPEDDAVANNLSYLLAERAGEPALAQRAVALASRFAQSRNPSYLDSLGYAHYRAGQYPQAVAVLERAARLAAPSPLLQLHLGKALVKSGQAERGRELIRRALDTRRDLPGADEARSLLG